MEKNNFVYKVIYIDHNLNQKDKRAQYSLISEIYKL